MANVLNHVHQGGAVTEIGGELRIASGGSITADGSQASAVTAVDEDLATDADGTEISVHVNANSVAINEIITALIGAGILAAE